MQPMDPFVVGHESLALDQDVRSPVAGPPALAGQFDQAQLQPIILSLGLVVKHAARQAQRAAGPALGELGLCPYGRHGVALCQRAQNFPRATTFSASLSSNDSTSIFLSFALFASSALSRQASGLASPGRSRHR